MPAPGRFRKGWLNQEKTCSLQRAASLREETAHAPEGDFIALARVTQKGGKVVHAWAIEGEFDPARFKSNSFSLEWPPRSKRFVEFPEVDRAEFFPLPAARLKINAAQVALLDELERNLRAQGSL